MEKKTKAIIIPIIIWAVISLILIIIGITLNEIAMNANGGKMPVHISMMQSDFILKDYQFTYTDVSSIRFYELSDKIPVLNVPFFCKGPYFCEKGIYSIGDIFLRIGEFSFLILAIITTTLAFIRIKKELFNKK